MKQKQLKILGYVILIIMVANLLLFAFQVVNQIVFWIIIVLGAIFAYWVLPRIKK